MPGRRILDLRVTNNMQPKKLVVLISGHGSNLQAIIDACKTNELNAEIVVVISNKFEAYGLERARQNDIPALAKAKTSTQTREEYDQELANLVAHYQPDWVVLAGWMRILTPNFLNRFHHRVVNLHPALPGTFPGIKAIERAYEAFKNGEIDQTGVMVHLVPDAGVDDGPVLAEKIVPIYADDTLEKLAQRVHRVEHEILVETLKTLIVK